MIKNSDISPKIPFKGLNLISHLIYHDGPYLSHFEDRNGKNVLFHWCNVTETHNQWLVFSVTQQQMSDFLQKDLSQRELLLHPEGSISYLVDINNEGEYDKVMPLSPNAIPEDYLSSSDSYFDESLSPYIGDGYAYLLGRVQELSKKIVWMQECESPIKLPMWTEASNQAHPEIDHSLGISTIGFFAKKIDDEKRFNARHRDPAKRFPEQLHSETANSSLRKELLPC